MSGTSCSRKYAKHYPQTSENKTSASGAVILAVILAVICVVGYLALFAH